jgi:hypothetical protein
MGKEAAIKERSGRLGQRKRGNSAGCKAGETLDVLRANDLRSSAANGRGDLRAICTPISRDHHQRRASVTVEDERLDDAPQLTPERGRGLLGRGGLLSKLFDLRLGTGIADVRGYALDRLGPVVAQLSAASTWPLDRTTIAFRLALYAKATPVGSIWSPASPTPGAASWTVLPVVILVAYTRPAHRSLNSHRGV